MTDYLQVITTVDDKNAADRIAEYVLEQQLAACVQISTCRSIYRWQGKVNKADEYLCIIKSRTQLYSELEKAIKHIHPYDVPEILATQVSSGNREYLEWLDQELRSDFKHEEGV
jgi:periplasmic divalent cation tolerance protein